MAGAALSRRLGDALGTRTVSPGERQTVVTAAVQVEVWDDLPPDVRTLVETIEQRLGWVDETQSLAMERITDEAPVEILRKPTTGRTVRGPEGRTPPAREKEGPSDG